MNTELSNYLHRQTTKPLMTVRYSDSHVSGRIYLIGTPIVTCYKFTTSQKGWGGHSVSYPVVKREYTGKEVVETYEKKGWRWSFITAYSGYELDCLVKEETFKELPKGDNLVGVTWREVLEGRDAIQEYMRENFRGFNPITIYRVPANLL